MLLALLQASPAPRTLEDGRLGMVNTALIADEVLRQREEIATAWAAAMVYTPEALQALIRDDLEGQLNAAAAET